MCVDYQFQTYRFNDYPTAREFILACLDRGIKRITDIMRHGSGYYVTRYWP